MPLDIALRRFLLDMILPKEAQQIDRVLDAFAKRYNACHPGLFRDPGVSVILNPCSKTLLIVSHTVTLDHAYILAFSLIMLHTDVYNRNNRHKMTRADYVRNTRLDGVSPAVLEVRSKCVMAAALRYLNIRAPPGLSREHMSFRIYLRR